jgi:exosome complex component RRP41
MKGESPGCRADWDRRIQEFGLALRQTFEEAVQLQLSPRSQIDISVLVLEQDGGVLQTAINAVTLALVDAGIPMNDYICATSAGLVDNDAILGILFLNLLSDAGDLNSIEEADIPHCTIATLGKSEKITLIQV